MRTAMQYEPGPVASARRCVLAAGVLVSAAAAAEPSGWQSSLALTSDYVDHGLSQTRGEPALQAGFFWTGRTHWYAGAWASNVDADVPSYGIDGADTEIDWIVGYRRPLDEDLTLDLQFVRYQYAGAAAPIDYDYTELALTLDMRRLLRLSIAYTPDYSALSHYGVAVQEPVLTVEVAGQIPVGMHVGLSAGVGYRDLDALYDTGYGYATVGLSIAYGTASLTLAQHFTDGEARRLFGDEVAGARTTATFVLDFGLRR